MKRLENKIETLINNSQYTEAVELLRNEFDFSFDVKFLENNYHFQGDKEKRDIYSITLKRGARKYTFKFGQSIHNSGKYKGHKHLCLNTFNQYLFSELEYSNLKIKDGLTIKYNEIVLNKDFKEPTLYDVLVCLQKYEVGAFEDFYDDFGYNTDSRTAKKTYKAVVKEFDKMCVLFNNKELEILNLIN